MKKMKKIAAGIMSGTSLDGIDVVIAQISKYNKKTKIKQIIGKTFDYPTNLLEKIKDAVNNNMDVKGISSLNFELAYLYAKCVIDLCHSIDLKTEDLDFVASHGQTVYHQGIKDDTTYPSTLQLGSGPVMSQLLKTTVISDFRAADMAQGGQGAPLVPFVDYILYSDGKKSRILQNIGGISNITVLPKGKQSENLFAFDTGPGNMMINRAMEVLYNKSYDRNGEVAFSGKNIKELFDEITSHPFLDKKPPKSCGREQFGSNYTDDLIRKYSTSKKEDIVHTISKASSYTMIDAIKKYVLSHYEIDELIIAGGGIHNNFLMKELEDNLKPIKVLTTNDLGLDSDFKEALAFIILGNQTINKKHGTIKQATGAKHTVIPGSISFYK